LKFHPNLLPPLAAPTNIITSACSATRLCQLSHGGMGVVLLFHFGGFQIDRSGPAPPIHSIIANWATSWPLPRSATARWWSPA